MAVSLWVSQAKYQFHLRSSSLPFCSDSPEWRSRHMVTWFGRHGDAFGTTENAFFRAFITLRSQFHLHHRSQQASTEIVSKNHPYPWTCPLMSPARMSGLKQCDCCIQSPMLGLCSALAEEYFITRWIPLTKLVVKMQLLKRPVTHDTCVHDGMYMCGEAVTCTTFSPSTECLKQLRVLAEQH